MNREANPVAPGGKRVQFGEPFLAPPGADGRGEQRGHREEQTAGGRTRVPVALHRGIGERFQFHLDRVHAELSCDPHEDIERFPGLAQLLNLRDELHGPHVVQPVRQLDRKNPGVGALHGGHHLGHPAPSALDLVQRGRSRHQSRHPGTELAAQCGQRVRGVLDRVVQHCRAKHLVIRAGLGQDRGDSQRMGDVRVTAPARLAPMPGCRHVIGPLDAFDVGIGPGNPENLAQAG